MSMIKRSMIKHKKQRGVSLIEVMIALLILAVGLLGFAGMQTRGITMGRKAFLNSQAVFLAQDLVERIRANCAVTAAGACDPSDYAYTFTSTTGFTAPTLCDSSNCTNTGDMVKYDQYKWGLLVQKLLPKGGANVTVRPGANGLELDIEMQYVLDSDSTNPASIPYHLRTQL